MLELHPDLHSATHSATHSTTAGARGRVRGCLLRILSRTQDTLLGLDCERGERKHKRRCPSESVVMAHDGDTIRFVLLFTLLGGSRE